MELFKLFGIIEVNNDEANSNIDETTERAEQAENKMSSAFKKIGSAVATYFAIDKIKQFGIEIVNVAAEVSAEASAFDQIMGDYSDQAAEKVGKIADATGMVSTRLTPYMTSMTAKFKGLGYDIDEATTLAQGGLTLAADAAAFWDKSLDESMSHLNSFINGSYEGGEAIGLFANDTQMASYAVKQGIVSEAKEWANLDEARKQATRLEYAQAMFEASGATGQAAKESEQYANVQANLTEKWRQFKAQIGEPMLQNVVLPAMTKLSTLVDKVGAAMQFLRDHSTAVKTVLISLGTVIGIVTTALTAQTVVQGVKAAMNAAEVTSLGALITAKLADAAATMAALVPYLLFAAAIAALIAIIVLLVKNWDKVREVAANVWEKVKEIWGKVAEWFKTSVIDPLVTFFTGLWNRTKNTWEGIKNVISFALQLIASIISFAIDLIMLPWRLMWEGIKLVAEIIWNAIGDKVTSALETIKNVITTVMNAIKEFITNVWNAVVDFLNPILEGIKNAFTTVWEAIKNVITTVVNAIKDVITSVWNAIVSFLNPILDGIKNTISNVFNSVKSTVSNIFDSIKSKVTDVWNGIKSAIETPINKARDTVKSAVDKIKSFFDKLKIKFPSIKLPHFSITGSFSLSPPSVPRLSIDWYKKAMDNAMVLNSPTIFGVNPSGQLMGAGEAGQEVVSGSNTLMSMIREAVQTETSGTSNKLEKLISILEKFFPELIENMGNDIVLDDGTLVGKIMPKIDNGLGEIDRMKGRGQ